MRVPPRFALQKQGTGVGFGRLPIHMVPYPNARRTQEINAASLLGLHCCLLTLLNSREKQTLGRLIVCCTAASFSCVLQYSFLPFQEKQMEDGPMEGDKKKDGGVEFVEIGQTMGQQWVDSRIWSSGLPVVFVISSTCSLCSSSSSATTFP